MIGDSHAAQLNYFFDVVGNESGVAYRVLTGSSCVPIPAFDLERLPRWARKPCQAQIDAVAQSMLNFDKIIVAGMWQYQMQSPAFAQAMRAFLVDTSYAGKQVVLLGQIPMFESNVQRVRRFRELGLSAPLVSSSWQGANQLLRALAEGIPNVRFMDFLPAPSSPMLLIRTESLFTRIAITLTRWGLAAMDISRAVNCSGCLNNHNRV